MNTEYNGKQDLNVDNCRATVKLSKTLNMIVGTSSSSSSSRA